MLRLGAHVSAAGSFELALDRARALGCECLQIFVGNPRQWAPIRIRADEARRFRARLAESGLEPLVAHSCYLINLANPTYANRSRSIRALAQTLRAIAALGGRGVVTHIGSRLGRPETEAIERVVRSLRTVLERTGEGVLYLENSAGGTIGGRFEELAQILDGLDGDERIRFCLDTAHLYGAGWDLARPRTAGELLDAFDAAVGLDRLGVLHLNDSKAELGSRRDRHENIGAGGIGRRGFRALLTEPRLDGLPGILETPGFAGQGPDRENLAILRELSRPTRRRKPPARARAASAPA